MAATAADRFCGARTGIVPDFDGCLANDHARTLAIALEVKAAFELWRKVLVLTERTEHLDAIASALNGNVPTPFVLHGRMSKKQRSALIAGL